MTATSLSETRLDTKETVVEWVESTEPELLEEAFPELAGGEFPEPAGEEVSGLAEEIMQMLEENPDLLNELPSELVPPLTLEDSLQSIDTLTAMNENLNEQLTEALKEEKFLEKDVLEEMIASLPDQPAAQELGAVLEEERAAALEEIKQLTKSLYTEEELSALEQLAENISGELAASAEILPVESVITNARDFKLDFPAIIEPTVQFIRGRPVSELFGVTVVWDDRDMTAAFIDGANVIVVQIGSHTGYMNGRPVRAEISAASD